MPFSYSDSRDWICQRTELLNIIHALRVPLKCHGNWILRLHTTRRGRTVIWPHVRLSYLLGLGNPALMLHVVRRSPRGSGLWGCMSARLINALGQLREFFQYWRRLDGDVQPRRRPSHITSSDPEVAPIEEFQCISRTLVTEHHPAMQQLNP